MDELISSLAAGKDTRATVVRAFGELSRAASCPEADGLIQFPQIQPFSG